MSEYDSELSFLNLRRLTMRGDMEIDDLGFTPTPILTRDLIPQLAHYALEETRLAYWGFMHHFSGVTDEITTLAVKDYEISGKTLSSRASQQTSQPSTPLSLSTSELSSSQVYS